MDPPILPNAIVAVCVFLALGHAIAATVFVHAA